jgi:hemoglobin-like flavoprotein
MSYDVATIQSSYEEIQPKALEFVEQFYAILWEDYPELQGLFKGSDDERFHAVFNRTMSRVIARLSKPERLEMYLKWLGARLVPFDIQDKHFEWGSNALLEALGEFFGAGWTPEIEDEWSALCEYISEVMAYGALEVRCADAGEPPPPPLERRAPGPDAEEPEEEPEELAAPEPAPTLQVAQLQPVSADEEWSDDWGDDDPSEESAADDSEDPWAASDAEELDADPDWGEPAIAADLSALEEPVAEAPADAPAVEPAAEADTTCDAPEEAPALDTNPTLVATDTDEAQIEAGEAVDEWGDSDDDSDEWGSSDSWEAAGEASGDESWDDGGETEQSPAPVEERWSDDVDGEGAPVDGDDWSGDDSLEGCDDAPGVAQPEPAPDRADSADTDGASDSAAASEDGAFEGGALVEAATFTSDNDAPGITLSPIARVEDTDAAALEEDPDTDELSAEPSALEDVDLNEQAPDVDAAPPEQRWEEPASEEMLTEVIGQDGGLLEDDDDWGDEVDEDGVLAFPSQAAEPQESWARDGGDLHEPALDFLPPDEDSAESFEDDDAYEHAADSQPTAATIEAVVTPSPRARAPRAGVLPLELGDIELPAEIKQQIRASVRAAFESAIEREIQAAYKELLAEFTGARIRAILKRAG